jgi:hypothetical protein
MTTDNFCFHLQNRLIQTGQTGGQQYSDTSRFGVPCPKVLGSYLQDFAFRFAKDKNSSVFGPFISYTENEEL